MKNLFILLMIAMCATFVSCSKDDDNDDLHQDPEKGVIIAVKDLMEDKKVSMTLCIPTGETVTVDWGDGTTKEYVGGAIEKDYYVGNVQLDYKYTIDRNAVTIKLEGYITKLSCEDNQFISLDVSDCIMLTYLDCYNNRLTSLDVSRCTALTGLWCSYNKLAFLDISKNTALTKLGCIATGLTSLDVSKNTALTMMWCGENQFTAQAMNNIYNALPRVTRGSLYCNKLGDYSIAEQKGWTVY